MTPDDELHPGEVRRSLARIEKSIDDLREEVRSRHHAINNKVEGQLGPLAILQLKAATSESDIKELQQDMQGLLVRAAAVSGAVAALVWLIQLFWKH